MDAMTAEKTVMVTQCAASKSGKRCGTVFQQGHGFVPDLSTLYEQQRGTMVHREYPLTRTEVLAAEMCMYCGRDPRFAKLGMKTFPTASTLQTMERWTEESVRRQVEEGQAWNARDTERQRKVRDRSFVVQTFEKLAPESTVTRHKKGRQYKGGPKPTFNPNAPKNFGDNKFVPKAEKPQKPQKKGKKNKDEKAKGR